MSKIKKIILVIWLLCLLGLWGYYFLHPEFFTKAGLAWFFQQFWPYVLLVYFIISCLRGIFFLPSTVLIFAGAFFLTPVSLFFFSLLWIVISSTIVYYFWEYLNLDEELKNPKNAGRIQKIENSINKNGFWIVALWAFVPMFPTDLICYLAGTTDMKYRTFIAGILLWETPLVIFYVAVSFGLLSYF